MIASRQNQRIKDIRRLLRCKGDRAVLEGPHLVTEAQACGLTMEYALATPSFLSSAAGLRLVEGLAVQVSAVSPKLLEELGDSDSPRGILAVVSLPRQGVDSLPLTADGLYLFVDGMQDPGNLGALVRVAEAFDVTAVALGSGTVHPNHPRALRASAGSLLRVRVATGVEPSQLDRHLAPVSPTWLALVPRGGGAIEETDLERTLVLAVGAEGPGLSSQVLDRADVRVSIPMARAVDSLNSTVATAILVYEVQRRR